MKRRGFITLLTGMAVDWASSALVQPQQGPSPASACCFFGTPDNDPNFDAFRRGLRDFGYVESGMPPGEQSGKYHIWLDANSPARRRNPLGGDVAPLVRAATSTIPVVTRCGRRCRAGGPITCLTLLA